MGGKINLEGKRFGRLLVVQCVGADNRGEALWECTCDCGNNTVVRGSHLRRGLIQSCGCYARELSIARLKANPTKGNTKHNGTHTRLYHTWVNMKTRCFNSNTKAFKWYGAVGVTICEEWLKFEKFREWALKSGYDETLTIERINPFGNYCPENCTWIPWGEQRKNQRRAKQWQCLN